MTKDELTEVLGIDGHDEYLKFERVQNKRSQRPDLHAFLVLDDLVTRGHDIVAGAEHDQIFLDIDVADLAKVVTMETVIDLVRCGVMYDEKSDSLAMFA